MKTLEIISTIGLPMNIEQLKTIRGGHKNRNRSRSNSGQKSNSMSRSNSGKKGRKGPIIVS